MPIPSITVSNPMGQGLVYDENFRVPRLGPGGQVQYRDPGANAGFYNGGLTSSPLDFIDNVIRREDFPAGPEGDAAFEAALMAFGAGGDPSGAAGRTPGQQANFDVRQAGGLASTAGSGSNSLALISWSQLHPQEALQALMAMDAGAVTDPSQWLDDAMIRDIVTGLGGVEAVNQMIAAERQGMIDSGRIPGAQPGTLTPGQVDGPLDSSGGNARGIPSGGAGGLGTVEPNVSGPSFPSARFPREDIIGFFTPDRTGEPLPPGAEDGSRRLPPQGIPVPQQPAAPVENGQVVGAEPLPDAYQYTAVGQDVYLDVTDPLSGSVHRFTGDVVEAAYRAHGASSFDELVARDGYEAAVAALFSFIQPPAAPSTGPIGGGVPGGGGAVQTPGGLGPVQPQPNRPRETTGRDPGFTQ